ncbi:hypothetical protein [uncultured Tenacibaculum sp.]|uniref:hypothetical protein n=1 Tax=uncultured Tenacibaculum sp. TaxID=174713 RepID=UPI002635E744|nr:hypothetical protein [uncultured Tenacibaculum sp.]
MSKRKSFWSKIILESLMIIFSVFIALFINEWKNEKNEAKRTKLIVQNIKSEIQNNREILQNIIQYHEEIMDRLSLPSNRETIEEKFLKNGYFAIREIAPNGIIQEQFQNIAWTVAKEDKITNRIHLNESQVLFAVYEQQNVLKGTIKDIVSFLSSREVQRKELAHENVMVFRILMNELVGQEKVLETMCINALEIIKKRENKSA